jgi:hypothetical protein
MLSLTFCAACGQAVAPCYSPARVLLPATVFPVVPEQHRTKVTNIYGRPRVNPNKFEPYSFWGVVADDHYNTQR